MAELRRLISVVKGQIQKFQITESPTERVVCWVFYKCSSILFPNHRANQEFQDHCIFSYGYKLIQRLSIWEKAISFKTWLKIDDLLYGWRFKC